MKAETGATPPAGEPEPKGNRPLWTVIAALPYLMPLSLLLLLAAAITLVAIGAYTREWEWTGFLGKTLWDWMKLLIVSVILALGGLLITQMDRLNSARAQQLERERLELDRRQTRERLELDRRQTQEQLALAQRGQISERFSRAVDQITSAFLSVRLGGIYSLERTAREDRDYHWPIMELLTNYVRGHVPINARPPTPATDIQA